MNELSYIRRDYSPEPIISAGVLSGTLTATFDMNGFNWGVLDFNYTYSAATALQWYIEHIDDGTNYFRVPMTEQDYLTGVIEYKDRLDQRTSSSSGKWPSIWNLPYGKCRLTVTSTSGGAGDLLTVRLTRLVLP